MWRVGGVHRTHLYGALQRFFIEPFLTSRNEFDVSFSITDL